MRAQVVGKAIGVLLILTCVWAPGSAQAADKSPSLSRGGQGALSTSSVRETYPIMRPDRETMLEWIHDYERAPRASIDEKLKARTPLLGSQSLLSHLNYSPVQRNQDNCGNCWVWAGTGVMEINLDVQEGIFDQLSVQYLNSCKSGDYACCGGNLSYVAQFYTDKLQAIPWSNTNAGWEDGDNGCGAGTADVNCSTIATTPNYPVNSITAETITTRGIPQATAIANIKNILDQNKAIYFAFWLANDADWQDFFNFWNNQSESALWDPNPYCGHTWIDGEGGGHAVLCVGYNDDVAEPYWIMLNSWGTAGGGRPNGLFRMKMDINYNCVLWDVLWDNNGGSLYPFPGLAWQTLALDWDTGPACTIGYTMDQQPAQFDDISSTGINLTLGDEDYESISIPFAFSFYCDPYTYVAVNSNGSICFDGLYLGFDNGSIPLDTGYAVERFLAPLWDDLNPSANGAVYYQIKGSAPNRRLIVQWEDVPHWYNSGAVTFQAILFEESNEILFQYQDVVFDNASYDNGASATVGIQHDAAAGVQYSFNAPIVQNGLAIKFCPSDSIPVCEQMNDGGFENGPPPASAWTEWSNDGTSWIKDIGNHWAIPAYAGTYVYWAGGYLDTPHSGSIAQSISIPSEATQLKFMANYYRPDANDLSDRDYFYIKINGTTVFTKELIQENNTYPHWIEEMVHISSYASQTITLQFEGISAGSYTGNVVIDTIRICEPGTHTPAAMPWVPLLLLDTE